MSRKVKQQLAQIRREVARDEILRMKDHVAKRRETLRELEARRKQWEKQRKLERRARLAHFQKELKTSKRAPAEQRRARLRVIAQKRAAFHEWWREVQATKARMLAEIQALRAELKAYQQQWPERRKLAVESLTSHIQRELDSFDDETRRNLDQLDSLIAKARRELKAESYDLQSWIRNRSGERKSKVKPLARAREKKTELESLVVHNLESPEELAWWRRNRTSIMRNAKEQGIEEPDAIAEMVREAVELEPERAVDMMQADADAWLAEELRKQGYAA